MGIRALTLAFLAVVAVTSCGVDADDDAGAPSTEPIASVVDLPQLDGGWSVDDLTVNGERIELDAAWPVTLTIEGDAISGIAACNRFIGSIDVTSAAGGGSFVVSDLSWTEMGCDQAAMEIEQSFLTALQVVDSYEAADGLYVTASGVGTGFHLVRSEPAETLQPNDNTDVNGADVSMPSPTEDLDPDGGLDGPVMYAARRDAGDVMEAAIIGTLELDGDCLYTSFEGNRYPVLFPYGTTWNEDSSSVVLPDGSTIALGGDLDGGGGYLSSNTLAGFTDNQDVLERARVCAEGPYYEVAVLQSI